MTGNILNIYPAEDRGEVDLQVGGEDIHEGQEGREDLREAGVDQGIVTILVGSKLI